MNKNSHRLIILIMAILFIGIYPSGIAHASDERKTFIMLNVDNTVDRIEKCDADQIKMLNENGIKPQKLDFFASKITSPKFIGLYEKLANGSTHIPGESNYMTKVEVEKIDDENFHITECLAIRPSLKTLLEKLHSLKPPAVILLTSRNDDTRTKNLQEKLDLYPMDIYVDGKKFKDLTRFVPRDFFRIKIDGQVKSLKSAAELRAHYPDIKKDDFVILLDHIGDSRFVKSDKCKDLNIIVSNFYVREPYDSKKDNKEVDSIIKKITDFTESKHCH